MLGPKGESTAASTFEEHSKLVAIAVDYMQ